MTSHQLTAENLSRTLGRYSITVVDVGARFGAEAAWWRLDPLAKLVGFEPDPDECRRLTESATLAGRNERYVPLGLGSRSGSARLFQTANPGCASLYKPRGELIARFPVLSCMTPAGVQEIELTTLDEWANRAHTTDIRFLKLDTQGSELHVLQGATRVLSECVGLEVEAEFSELYEGQPLFADVDRFLRAQGFVLWRLGDLCHYAEVTSDAVTFREDAYYGGRSVSTEAGNGRLFWGNAVYFRDYLQFDRSEESARRLLTLACLFSARGDRVAAAACVERLSKWGILCPTPEP